MKHMKNLTVLSILLALAGCGGADFSSSGGRSGGFDQGLSGGYGGYGSSGGYGGSGAYGSGGNLPGRQGPLAKGQGVYPHFEVTFELPGTTGNPFDFAENDVLVTFQRPDGASVRVPAFFDGGVVWKARYSPDVAGRFTLAGIKRNDKTLEAEKISKREFDVTGSPTPGFIRKDPKDKLRFAFDNGNSFYPLGHNVAWGKVEEILPKMGAAGENWSRIWMNHWDDKDLGWPQERKMQAGELDLQVAKRWDDIVGVAEKSGVYFQMVLQHHGQYSTNTDANWAKNPWNSANGGWLKTADEFFSDERAVRLTKARYRYIVARWGYSPNVMAWELFNEVHWTDAMVHKHVEEVADWHQNMAEFLRKQDPYKRLVTTSAELDTPSIWASMDYLQPHLYAEDLAANVGSILPAKLDKPIFLGEAGPSSYKGHEPSAGIRSVVWPSIMSEAGGAAQYWAWEMVEKENLYSLFKPASDFVRQSGLLSKRGLVSGGFGIETKQRGPITFSPGLGWAPSKRLEFTALPSGAVTGLSEMPAYLQGKVKKEMFPSATLNVSFAEAGTCTITTDSAAKAGALLTVSVDGAKAAEQAYPASAADSNAPVSIEVKVPAGSHAIRLENMGEDWVRVKSISLSGYGPVLRVFGKSSSDFAVAYVSRRQGAQMPPGGASGTLSLAGLKAGEYKVAWWDTNTGKVSSEQTATVTASLPLSVETPPIVEDAAVVISRTGDAAKAQGKALAKKAQ